MSHGLFGKLLGFLKTETQDEEDHGEDDADSQTGAPNRIEVVGGGSGSIY